MEGKHEAHTCGCGCHHDHDHDHAGHMTLPGVHTPARDALDPQDIRCRQTLQKMQTMAKAMQGLHDEIDTALAKVSQQNIGYILTQKKNVKKLEQLYEACFSQPLEHPLYETMRQAEQEYLVNIKSILREARQLKRGQAKSRMDQEG